MEKKVSDIKLACEKILMDFAESKPDWKYVKSKKDFVKTISKNSSVDVCTGMSSKVDCVNFKFGIVVVHKLVSKAIEHNKWNYLIYRPPERWLDKSLRWGSCTVFDHNIPYLREFDQLRAQGKKNYVRLEEFPERLNAIFTLAEAEIDKLFDLSSEEALIKSIVNKPIGYFRPNEVLLVQLLLGNPAYYDELVDFYNQPNEILRPLRKEQFRRQAAEKLMEVYNQGNFPKFDFA